MNVSALQSQSSLTSASGLTRLRLNSTSASKSTSNVSTEDTANVSGPGEMYAKLQQLQQQDPAKFKEVCQSISEELQAAADEQGDSFNGNMLSDLADKFASVAEGGDISQLQPPPPPPPGNGPEAVSGQYTQQDQELIQQMLDSLNTSSTSETSSQDAMQQIFSSIMDKIESALT